MRTLVLDMENMTLADLVAAATLLRDKYDSAHLSTVSGLDKGETFEFKVRLSKDGTPFWTMTPEQLAKELQSKND